ncbi:helix-turn-helix protein [Mesorhizobium sp. J18]|nr:helix-turn-helix protein [Mesorhizobium sp. J18]
MPHNGLTPRLWGRCSRSATTSSSTATAVLAGPWQQGLIVNHKQICRLMRQHGLQPKVRRRFVVTTDSGQDRPLSKDIVQRIRRFIDEVYNKRRLHSAFGYLSPQLFEDRHVRQSGKTAACSVSSQGVHSTLARPGYRKGDHAGLRWLTEVARVSQNLGAMPSIGAVRETNFPDTSPAFQPAVRFLEVPSA